MASTEMLMDLIEEFPGAFEEPEQEQVKPVATDESSNDVANEEEKPSLWGGNPVLPLPEFITVLTKEKLDESFDRLERQLLINAHGDDMQKCIGYLGILADKPMHLKLAEALLYTLVNEAENDTTVVRIKAPDEDLALDLPETYARETSKDCPSGMCPIDH